MNENAKIALGNFKYPKFRKHQEETITKVVEAFDDHECVMLCAPTGIGKSAIADSVASIFSSAYYVVGVKMLQDQLKNEFPDYADIRGRANYDCQVSEGKACDDGMCVHDRKYRCSEVCPYRMARDRAVESHMCLTNIFYFYLEGGHVFENRSLLIVDEAHALSEQLIGFAKVTISPRTVFGSYNTVKDMSVPKMLAHLEIRKNTLEHQRFKPKDELRRYNKLKSVVSKLQSMPDEFVVTKLAHARILTPLYSKKQATNVFERADKVLLMSATLNRNLSATELGLKEYFGSKRSFFIDVPSVFPAINRPLFCLPIANFKKVNQTDENIEKMRVAVKMIADKHENERGLVFLPGYRYMDMLKNISDRFMFHTGDDRNEVLQEWLECGGNKILAGVKFEEGLDLKDDIARFGILMKAPFPDSREARVKARLYRQQWHWFNMLAAMTLSQAYGRFFRSETDWGSVYVLDIRAIELLRASYTPKWIREAMIGENQKTLGKWNDE